MQIVRTFFLAALICGCASSKMEARLATVEQANRQHQQDVETLTKMLTDHIAQDKDKDLRFLRDKFCKDPQVAQFMTELEEGVPETCSEGSMNQALGFMRNIPSAVVHLNPGADLKLRPIRLGRLKGLLDPSKLRSSTRVLILAKPAEDTKAGRDRAIELANVLKNNFLLKILSQPRPSAPAAPAKDSGAKSASSPGEVQILSPFLLPCQLRKDVSQLYTEAHFQPIPGEPALGKPAVVLFVYVTDC